MSRMRRTLATTAILLAGTDSALACAVCYGAADAPILAGMNMSILFMLGLTYLILGAFASFFIYLRRRERMFRGESD